jgi:hypothetical protein
MTHQKLTTKFPTEIGRENLPPMAAAIQAEGIRPHPRQTRRKEAAETDSMMTARGGIPHNTGAGMVRTLPARHDCPVA